MSRTRSPYKRILERIFESTMNLVTNILNSRVTADDECLVEIGVDAFSIE